jgi:cell wall-associated NlpC family hydrolase
MAKEIHTPVGDAPVIPVALMVSGLYLCWFGVHYWRTDTRWPTDPVKGILTGKGIPKPDRSADTASLQAVSQSYVSSTAQGSSGGVSNNIAADALKYQGTGYVWGGAADKVGNWDCSSFVSYVLGHDLGMRLPGGGKYGDTGYPPHTHGPTTLSYMLFGTAISRSQVQAGDLVVSSDHMGICISSSQYVSARTPAKGVGIDNLSDPFPGGAPVFRRV